MHRGGRTHERPTGLPSHQDWCHAEVLPDKKSTHALLDKVLEALNRLVAAGIISPVTKTDWATPIVPVLKKDGTVRICGDLKSILNLVCELKQYLLPLIGDIFAQLGGGERFRILDLRTRTTRFRWTKSFANWP